jgi:hypothetical protein
MQYHQKYPEKKHDYLRAVVGLLRALMGLLRAVVALLRALMGLWLAK